MSTGSSDLFARAQQHIPGGVNSPVRAFRNVGGEPFFVARAEGASIWDVDGKEYIDYIGSWGPAILGHAPKVVVEAVRDMAASVPLFTFRTFSIEGIQRQIISASSTSNGFGIPKLTPRAAASRTASTTTFGA